MNANAELLNFVYQNSQMGVDTLAQLLEISEDAAFAPQLQAQHRQYQAIHQQAREQLNASGYDEKGLSALEKVKTYLMVNMQTLTDKSTSHIAEMLIVGSTMGIIQAVRKLRDYEGQAEGEIIDLMRQLLRFEEDSIQQLKAFL